MNASLQPITSDSFSMPLFTPEELIIAISAAEQKLQRVLLLPFCMTVFLSSVLMLTKYHGNKLREQPAISASALADTDFIITAAIYDRVPNLSTLSPEPLTTSVGEVAQSLHDRYQVDIIVSRRIRHCRLQPTQLIEHSLDSTLASLSHRFNIIRDYDHQRILVCEKITD